MGLGKPEEIAALVKMGYSLFDCVIPTREARHQRLYVFNPGMDTPDGVRVPDGKFYKYHYAMDDKHARDGRPVDENCDCELCRRHSKAYLHHLFKAQELLALEIASIHNLAFYLWLVGEARKHIIAGDFSEWKSIMIRRVTNRL